WNACKVAGGILQLPVGNMMVNSFSGLALFLWDWSANPVNGAGINGQGRGASTFIPTPNFPFSQGGSGFPIFFRTINQGAFSPGTYLANFSINGLDQSLSVQNPNASVIGGGIVKVFCIDIIEWGATITNFSGFAPGAGSSIYSSDIDAAGFVGCFVNSKYVTV